LQREDVGSCARLRATLRPSSDRPTGACRGDYDCGHVRLLLNGFRLLEAAGACEVIGGGPDRGRGDHCGEWWSALATTARAYRRALLDAAREGYGPVKRWAEVDLARPDASYFAEERARLSSEYEYWLKVVPGGAAYVVWLSAYVAAAELDGRRVVLALRQWCAIASEFLDTSVLAEAPSLYEQLQGAADGLERFLPMPEHALRDMRRFTLLPETFPS
jgi:hypothetical protein